MVPRIWFCSSVSLCLLSVFFSASFVIGSVASTCDPQHLRVMQFLDLGNLVGRDFLPNTYKMPLNWFERAGYGNESICELKWMRTECTDWTNLEQMTNPGAYGIISSTQITWTDRCTWVHTAQTPQSNGIAININSSSPRVQVILARLIADL